MEKIDQYLNAFASFMWGTPLVILLVGGGFFLVIYSRFLPYLHFRHGLKILFGYYDKDDDHGHIPHFQALSAALSGTLGLGNIAGVAIAIHLAGPGAVFWMWVTAIVGIATKYYTCTLAIMYRGYDSQGVLQGGPMYVIREGLGRRWMPLAMLFAIAGLIGTLPVFQVNQLVQIIRDVIAIPAGITSTDQHLLFDLVCGLILAFIVGIVVIGNIKRVGHVTARLVPIMVILYLLMTFVILFKYAQQVPTALALIFSDAFTGKAVAGGSLTAVILMGVRRGAFSNEAGIGTEVMAHGAAKTNEPVREGLVAMLGPVIDTLIVCTCTALVILVTDSWHTDANGVTLTAKAFELALPGYGALLLVLMVILLSLSTVFTFWYYGSKCLGFLIGAENQHIYVWIYTLLVIIGAVVSLDAVVGLIDGMYAVMAIPTMISTLLLASHVNKATREYFKKHPGESHLGWNNN